MVQIVRTEPKGYPKAYDGTPRGEVRSKHKAYRYGEFAEQIPTQKGFYKLPALCGLCLFLPPRPIQSQTWGACKAGIPSRREGLQI